MYSLGREPQSFDEMALDNLLCGSGRSVVDEQRRQIPWPIIVGVLVVIVGAAGILSCPNSLGVRFSEALFIAGFLSLTVDLYLKRKLQRDVARDIFHHLLGINLPIEIRESIKDSVQQNHVYRRNMEIEARATCIDGSVRLEISISSQVIAATNTTYEHKHLAEDAERPTLLEVSLTSATSPKLNYSYKNVHMEKKDDEPEVLQWRKKTKLVRGQEVYTYSRFSVEGRGLHDFWTLNFGSPVIHPRLRVYGDEKLTVTASLASHVNANEYFYQKVFVVGDHLQIRWKPGVSGDVEKAKSEW